MGKNQITLRPNVHYGKFINKIQLSPASGKFDQFSAALWASPDQSLVVSLTASV